MTAAAIPQSTPAPTASGFGVAHLTEGQKLMIFGVMAFGQFMALLDIQIVAASLNSIQAGLSAGPDEISWVQTAYLMAEIVMIPLAAFLTQALSTRVVFAASAFLFTISSLMCGLAWDINTMIAFRAIQGFTGGAMIPTVFATGFTLFEGPKRAMIPGILGLVSTLAPTLGPTVGGWITDVASWRWLFFMNVAPGAAVTVLILMWARVDEAVPAMLRRIDWAHMLSMAVFLGGLEYVLEEGPRHDWLTEPAVAIAAWLSFVAALLFLERSFFSKGPIVKLSPFRRPTFAFACLFNFVIGVGLYAATYLVPVFLGRVRGYSSFEIGTTVFVSGIAMSLGAPIAAMLSQRIDQRIVITVGLSLFAAGLWLFSYMTPDWGFSALFLPQVVRGFAILLCIVPSVGLALTGFEQAELRYASGLFNLMRNLGGAVGIALVNTWLGDNAREHALKIGVAMGEGARTAPDVLAGLAGLMSRYTPDPAQAQAMAEGLAARIVGRQALAAGFDDVFRIMAWMFIAALVMVPFCRPAAQTAPAADSP
ncbi:MAG TPA: DHA2 family efflux MFS transporter permease subunit [Caulobacteraceae bacterium]|nr:DHA2 family efflux MFS transporter permease subunit [Caulobacteraceae bacterium]